MNSTPTAVGATEHGSEGGALLAVRDAHGAHSGAAAAAIILRASSVLGSWQRRERSSVTEGPRADDDPGVEEAAVDSGHGDALRPQSDKAI